MDSFRWSESEREVLKKAIELNCGLGTLEDVLVNRATKNILFMINYNYPKDFTKYISEFENRRTYNKRAFKASNNNLVYEYLLNKCNELDRLEAGSTAIELYSKIKNECELIFAHKIYKIEEIAKNIEDADDKLIAFDKDINNYKHYLTAVLFSAFRYVGLTPKLNLLVDNRKYLGAVVRDYNIINKAFNIAQHPAHDIVRYSCERLDISGANINKILRKINPNERNLHLAAGVVYEVIKNTPDKRNHVDVGFEFGITESTMHKHATALRQD